MSVPLAGGWRHFQDYQPLGFGKDGKGSAPLTDVEQLIAHRTLLCLGPWWEAGGAFKIIHHLTLW